MRFNRVFIILMIIGMLSGCTGQSTPVVLSLTSEVTKPVITVEVPRPTVTKEATATTAPTIAPTEKPTPMPTVDAMQASLEKFNGVDCSNWKEPCTIATAADLKDGVLLAYAKSVAKPFGPEVSPIKKVWATGNIIVIEPCCASGPQYSDFNKILKDPEKTPVNWVANFFIKGDRSTPVWNDVFISIEQFLNTDGSVGFLQFEWPVSNNQERRQIVFQDMLYGVPMRPEMIGLDGKPIPKEQWGNKGEDIVWDAMTFNADLINKLLDQWVATGIIPAELENMVLAPHVARGGYFQK